MFAKRLTVLISAIIILMCLGVAYSWGVFLLPIDNDLGWGRAKISFAVSILLFFFSLFMAIGGLLDKKYGPKITSGLGGLFIGFGWVLASFATKPIHLYLTYGVMCGIGTGLSYMSPLSAGIKSFPKKKGLITGIIVFGFGFGTTFLSPVLVKAIESIGWRNTMIYCGTIFGIVIVLASQFLKEPENGGLSTSQSEKENRMIDLSPMQMIKTNDFKVIFFTYLLSMVAGMMTIAHINAFALDINFTIMEAAFTLTILSFCNGLGRIIAGYLSDRLGGKTVLIGLFIIISLSMFALGHANNFIVLYFLAATIGLCFGGFLAVYPPITSNLFGQKYFSINYGLVFIGYGTGCFIGPFWAGIIYDITKSYLLAFNIAGALTLLGALLIFLLLKTYNKDLI